MNDLLTMKLDVVILESQGRHKEAEELRRKIEELEKPKTNITMEMLTKFHRILQKEADESRR